MEVAWDEITCPVRGFAVPAGCRLEMKYALKNALEAPAVDAWEGDDQISHPPQRLRHVRHSAASDQYRRLAEG
jgi:hypothetical protein